MRFQLMLDEPIDVQIEKNPNLQRVFDTTNDSFSCVLKANTEPNPIKPMTEFKVTFEDNTTQTFWIINDSVSVFSHDPKTYKHTLTLVQYRYFLNKHLLRNTVLNQPKKKNQTLYLASSVQYEEDPRSGESEIYEYGAYREQNTVNINTWHEKVSINNHTKIKRLVIGVKMYGQLWSKHGTLNYELQRIYNTTQLAKYNAQLKSNVQIVIINTVNQDTIGVLDLFDYWENPEQLDSLKDDINDYIENNGSMILGALVRVNGQYGSNDKFEIAFAEKVQNIPVGSNDDNYDVWRNICFQLEIQLELYNYTMLDVIDTLLKQNQLTSDNYGSKRPQLFYLPEESTPLYKLLSSTYMPDHMAFTQATFYDALAEIFRFFDAGFKFDETKHLDIEYYNDYGEERTDLKFAARSMTQTEREYNSGKVMYYQNALQQVKIDDLSTRSLTLGVVEDTDYGLVFPKPIYDVNKMSRKMSGKYMLFNVDTWVTLDLDITPFVVEEEIWSVLPHARSLALGVWYDKQELTQENTLHYQRGGNFINTSERNKNAAGNTLAYRIEQITYIAWVRFFGVPDLSSVNFTNSLNGRWTNLSINVDYVCLNNGRSEIQTIEKKYPGSEVVNQSDGLIDLNKVGLNILGESLKNGEPTLEATCAFSDWDSRPKEGEYIVYENERWLVNVVNINIIREDLYQATVEFSKNFNALSLRVRSDSEKRLTSISGELTVVSEDNYIDYIYVDDQNASISAESIPLNYEILDEMLVQTFNKASIQIRTLYTEWTGFDTIWQDYDSQRWNGLLNYPLLGYNVDDILEFDVEFDTEPETYNIQVLPYTHTEGGVTYYGVRFNVQADFINEQDAYEARMQISYKLRVNPYNIDVAGVTTLDEGDVALQRKDIFIPMLKYGFGNSICFEMQYDHPVSAGNRMVRNEDTFWWGAQQYFTEAKPYTDEEGWADNITFKFYSITDAGKKNGIFNYYPQLKLTTALLPIFSGEKTLQELGQIYKLNFLKKPNEILALNYQWCFLPYQKKNFFIGNKFINENFVTAPEKMQAKKFYLYYIEERDSIYSPLDTKGLEESEIEEITVTTNKQTANKVRLIVQTTKTINANVWAICDEFGDIYFASNNPATFTNNTSTTKFLTFTTKRNRI